MVSASPDKPCATDGKSVGAGPRGYWRPWGAPFTNSGLSKEGHDKLGSMGPR